MSDGYGPLGRDALLKVTRESRAALDAAIGGLSDDEMTAPVLDDGWSMQDLISHIAAWEERIASAIDAGRRGERVHWPEEGFTLADVDALNARDLDRGRALTLDEARTAAAAAHAHLLAAVEPLSDTDLLHDAPNRGPLSRVVRANGDEHYDEHRAVIDKWRAGR